MIHRTLYRSIASTLIVALLAEVFIPATAAALTSGPVQPEFSSFEPVATTSMVNEFTGAFNYNLPVISIPGPNGMGYALSLSYHNATSVEEEASWVGLGWTLNPGSIGRVKRGFPDEYKGAEVEYWNKVRDNWTASVTKRIGVEAFSGDVTAGLFTTLRYNNYTGYGYVSGVNLGIIGAANISFAVADGKSSWGFTISPIRLLTRLAKGRDDHTKEKEKNSSWADRFARSLSKQVEGSFPQISSSGGIFGVYTFNDYTIPINTSSYQADTWMAAIAAQGDPLPDVGVEGGIGGSYSVQKSIPRYTRKAYGYMYSGVADKFGGTDSEYKNIAMDYYIEKDAPYNKRDAFLGIPFSNADNFIVSGEGLSGSFRLHQRRLGHFRPPYSNSATRIRHINLDFHFGGGFGVGADLGYGDHYLRTDRWGTAVDDNDGGSPTALQFSNISTDDEPYYYRFADDMGGYTEFAEDDAPVQASVSLGGLSMEGVVSSSANQGKRTGRAAYIGFNTNDRINYHPPLNCWDGAVNYGVEVRRYAREKGSGADAQRISRFIVRDGVRDDVGEFAITKEDGTTYVYGLPVYAREEAELQFGVQGISASQIDDFNFHVYKHRTLDESADYSIVGEVRKSPYPSMYLLTEILSPDYIDRSNNGPTPDDLGGYVLFNYEREAGGNDKKGALTDWYRWRTPYKGLHYQRNSFSDPMDDVGTVQSGYKEIYYLNSIETRTHKAVFVRSERRDGYPAETNEQNASEQTGTSAADVSGSKKLFKLDRIKLHAKDGTGNLSNVLTTVNFEYDYSLCEGLPNSEMGAGNKRLGKLTLKKVWFEHEGVYGVKISPYEFGYEYRTTSFYPQSIRTRYPGIVNHGDNWTDGPNSEQNPDYSPFNIDCWGNYQHNGQARHANYIPWVDQSPDPLSFDPAAWQLKWIKLPSGGEIHVQYEQNEYRYVQHRPAMAMVSLQNETGPDELDNEYHLNAADLGLTNATDVGKLRTAMQEFFRENPEHIYFKFLYALKGTNTGLGQCSSEFISGYGSVDANGVGGTGTDIAIKIGNGNTNYSMPVEVCRDFVTTSRSGVVQKGTSCDPSVAGVKAATDEASVGGVLFELHAGYTTLAQTIDNALDPPCQTMNYANSYVRVPMTTAKLGGGIRVKRLLMYDPGLEGPVGDDVALYGTEYIYQTEDGQSSGVATNEPGIGREENPLVGSIKKRRDKNTVEDILSADEREQFEGPLGESIMPGASVGYSRVVARSIHEGKTQTGYAVSEFFTARDYPFDLGFSTSPSEAVRALKADRTEMNGPPLRQHSMGVPVASQTVSSIWRTQGFRFVLNGMNGKPKSITKYSGKYGTANAAVVERISYDYYEPGESIPVMNGPDDEEITLKPLGKEMEVVLASRTVEDITHDYGIEADVGGYLGFLIPLPFGSIQGSFRQVETILKTHVTTKIIHYPAVQKRVTVMKDGITDVTEYIGFDEKSGKAVLTRNYDGHHGVAIGNPAVEHDGSYYAVTLPAWRYYAAMGQIAERQGLKFGGDGSPYSIHKRFDATRHYLHVNINQPIDQSTLFDQVATGDLVEVKVPLYEDQYGNVTYERLGVYHIGTIAGSRIELLPTSYSLLNDFPVRSDVLVEILRPANTNQLTTNAGSFTTYGMEPNVAN